MTAPPPTLARLTARAEDIVLLKPAPDRGWVVDKVLAGSTFKPGEFYSIEIPNYPLLGGTMQRGATPQPHVDFTACLAFSHRPTQDGRPVRQPLLLRDGVRLVDGAGVVYRPVPGYSDLGPGELGSVANRTWDDTLKPIFDS